MVFQEGAQPDEPPGHVVLGGFNKACTGILMNKKSNAKNTISTDEILRKAISVYGEKAQLLMLVEEMEELWGALTSVKDEKELVIEEMADVSICLKQTLMMFNLTDDHYPANGTSEEFAKIEREVRLFICRASRGREYSPESLWHLAGWIRKRAEVWGAQEEIKEIARKKIARLARRITEK